MNKVLNMSVYAWDGVLAPVGFVFSNELLDVIKDKNLFFFDAIEDVYECEDELLLSKLEVYGKLYRGDGFIFIVGDSINAEYAIVCKIRSSINGKTKFGLSLFSKTKSDSEDYKKKLITDFGSYKQPSAYARISWAILSQNEIKYIDVDSLLDETILKEAYPFIDNLDKMVEDYLNSKSNVLILQGSPGTGKTRLIKYILQQMIKRKGYVEVLYAMDEKVFSNDAFFLKFLTGTFDALVLEDIDFNLKSRKDGNMFMAKLLSGSDGIITNLYRKIILSTNIPSIGDIDDALLRPGRCFDVIQTRKLSKQEAMSLATVLTKGEHISIDSDKEFGLSDVYDAVYKHKLKGH